MYFRVMSHKEREAVIEYIKGLTGEDLDVALWVPKSDKIKCFNLTMKPYDKPQEPKGEYTTGAPDESDLPF